MPTEPTIHEHPDWPAVQTLIDRETAIGKAAAPVAVCLAAGIPVPTGNVAQLRECLIAAGYLDLEGRPA